MFLLIHLVHGLSCEQQMLASNIEASRRVHSQGRKSYANHYCQVSKRLEMVTTQQSAMSDARKTAVAYRTSAINARWLETTELAKAVKIITGAPHEDLP